MSVSFAIPAEFQTQPATARLVYLTLDLAEHPLTYDEIMARTGVGRSSARRAITEFRDRGVVESVSNPQNPYGKRHRLVDDAPSALPAE